MRISLKKNRSIQIAALAAAATLGPARAGLAQVKAFPEAEGFGRFATGARTNLASATVYHVTNLNNSGAGSFRDAVSQSNRFIVFDVGGIAKIDSVVTFASNITIAGQTAPGGFQVYGNRVAFHNANNLISRYWGARNASSNDNDAASLASGQNMIWDHMSISWGVDGTFDINPDSGATIDNLTIQNTIIAQGLQVQNHSTGGLMTLSQDRNFSVIKSLFADNKTRNPKARGNNEFINNVTYGWTGDGYIMGDTVNEISRANVEGNYYIRGPLASSGPFTNGTAQFEIYGNENYFDSDQDGILDGALVTIYPGATVVQTRHNFPTTSVMPAQDALEFVLNNAGPSITRDVVDTNIVAEVRSYGTAGGLINRETDVYPNYDTDPQYLKPRARLVDTDNDGMPDNWETSRGYNPGNNADWKTLNGSYTRLEDYLNELGGYVNTKSATAGGAWTAVATWGGAVPSFSTSAVATGGITHASGNGFARQAALDGASTVSGGTLDVFDTALIGAAGNGSLTISGGTVTAGQIVLGATGQSGSLVLNGGTLQVGPVVSGGGTALFTINGGTVKATSANSLNVAVPTTIGGAGGTINTNGFNGTIAGLSGNGSLTKTGSGTLTLGGNNSGYSGSINLNAGAITLATNSANSSTGAITAASGTQINVTTSGASTPLAIASGATVTISAGGLTYNGAVTGTANTTLVVSNSSSGTSNFSIGGNLTNFAGTLDLAASTGNIRIGGGGSALTKFDAGDSTGTFRTTFDGTTNFGSLAGGANTRLQGSTNGTVASTYVIGANGNSTTFAGTITNGTNATPAILNITKAGTGTLTLTNAASTYTGVTTVAGGMLSVTSLANGGAASSIGQSTSAAANLVFDGGTLRYTGGAVSTDRLFTIAAGGGTLDASGSGAEAWSNTGSVIMSGNGNRTLTLNGTSTGPNTLHALIGDPASGKTSVTKSGAGTWRLLGAPKAWSGDTTVSGGKLVMGSNLLSSNTVTVQSGATLQLAPGSDAVIKTPTISVTGGKLDVGDNRLITATAVGSWNGSAYTGVTGMIQSGRGDGSWNGSGIVTSMSSATMGVLTTLAVGNAGELGYAGGAFGGVSVGGGDTLAMYTWGGDADLNGELNGDDYFYIDSNVINSGSVFGFHNGDFDYSGTIDGDDYFIIDSNILQAQSSGIIFAARAGGGLASVPEPAALAVFTGALSKLIRRRRGTLQKES